jgi:hypothetical protein
MQKEVISEQQEIEEQAIDGEPLTIARDDQDQAETSTRRSFSRTNNTPKRYRTWANFSLLKNSDIIGEQEDGNTLILKEGEPFSYNEAQNYEIKFEWNVVMEKKMQLLEDNGTWMLQDDSQSQPIIDCCWVYKLKDDLKKEDKNLYKARLVANRYTQEKGVGYNEMFSLVAKLSTFRLICALVAIFGLVLDQMDVVTAFFYGALEEIIYMRQPQDFAKKGKESWIYRLLKSLYGLK